MSTTRVFPPSPDLPASQRRVSEMVLRYEDVSQDGDLQLWAMPTGHGVVGWAQFRQEYVDKHRLDKSGIIPILTRLVFRGGERPVAVTPPVQAQGGFTFAHARDAQGAVSKVLLDMWCEFSGKRGTTHGFPVEGQGETITLGAVFAEHVLTRPFGPAEERKVTSVSVPGLPPHAGPERAWRTPEATIALPETLDWLGAESMDAAPIVFGLVHTDSNQHVNSLVYPRLFEEAVLRHAPELLVGKRCRFADVAFRKPCFAGEGYRAKLRLYRDSEGDVAGIGAVVSLHPGADGSGRGHTFAHLWFE